MTATASSILKNKGDKVLTVTAMQTVADVADLLARNRIGAVPVVNAAQEVVGIISERDIVRGLSQTGPSVVTQPVDTLMTRELKTCGLDDTNDTLMQMMSSSRIRHLPVVEGKKLIGIISIGDVVKQRLDEAQFEVESLRTYIAG